MKKKFANSNSIFRDRRLSDFTQPEPKRLYQQDDSDLLEGLLRGVLMLCLLASLFLCGWRIAERPASTVAARAQHPAPVVAKASPACPSPAAQS